MENIHIAILRRGFSWEEVDPAVTEIDGIEYPDDYQNAVDPITLAVIVGSAMVLEKLIMRFRNELRGGVVLDLSKKPIELSRNADVPHGIYVIIAADGQEVKILSKDEPKDSIERMVEGILSLAVDPAGATKEKVHEVVDATIGRQAIADNTEPTNT